MLERNIAFYYGYMPLLIESSAFTKFHIVFIRDFRGGRGRYIVLSHGDSRELRVFLRTTRNLLLLFLFSS